MKEQSDNDKDLAEQFTVQGFCALSMWSSLIFIQSLFVLELIGGFSFLNIIKLYGIIWLVLFVFLCLIPKLRGEK